MKHMLLLSGLLLCLCRGCSVAQPVGPVKNQTLSPAGSYDEARTEMPDARMLRFPDVSREKIVFMYADDLWIVPKDGGLARKLSSPKGHESFPKFSPDGQSIAFSGNYDGNTDVYIVSAEGGMPQRLTHHPDADLLVEWYTVPIHKRFRPRTKYEPSGPEHWIYKTFNNFSIFNKLLIENDL